MNLRCLLPIAAVLLSGAALAQQPTFNLKDESPRTGTLIKRNAVTSSLPIDKSWSQLTPEQMASFKENYEAMAPEDEPPYPLNGSKAIFKAISAAQNKLHLQGRLMVVARIDSEGVAQSIQVLDTPDKRMSDFVAHVMMDEKYKPAVCKGVPCSMDYPLRFNFEIKH